jgi:hypothetical protein
MTLRALLATAFRRARARLPFSVPSHTSAMKLPELSALRALGAHARALSDPSRSYGGWETPAGSMGYAVLGPEVRAFLATAQAHGWVTPDVDWVAWNQTEEAKVLQSGPSAIATADVRQLVCLTTALVRADRFNEGTLLHAASSGVLGAVARRAGVLGA